MSTENGWNDWAQAWRDDAATAPGSDIAAIEGRVRKEQRRQTLRAAIDVLSCLVAIVVSVWAILRGGPGDIVVGLAGAGLSLFALALTLGRRRVPGALASRTVAAALEWEIATAWASVRTSIGGVVTAAAALVYLLLCTLIFRHQGVLERSPNAFWVLGGALVFAVGAGLSSFWLLRRRRARVARLERLLSDLTDEVGD